MPDSVPLAGMAAGIELRPESVVAADSDLQFGAADDQIVAATADAARLASFEGEVGSRDGHLIFVGPRSRKNIAALRSNLPWLRPKLLGLRTAVGFGDRLGLATPGHVRALRRVGGKAVPLFAQQSIREMDRSRRSAQDVIDDATWGVFITGWRDGFGADGDHLKAPDHIDECVAAGDTFFTFDPGEHVDNQADALPSRSLADELLRFPWNSFEGSLSSVFTRYRGLAVTRDLGIEVEDEDLGRAILKYGRAVAHLAKLYRHLEGAARSSFEVEISVDETDTPTTPLQHIFIATEAARLGVRWVSLAPRFVGRFEKGVDYIGSVAEFERHCASHAAIARTLGPYKISLHSGSDKLSIYPALRRAAGSLVHLKTAGTSYLEALRTVARLEPLLFREILDLARESYSLDRTSYHVSASVDAVPASTRLANDQLPVLLEDFNARQILHVTFGTVLGRVGVPLHAALFRSRTSYESDIETHFVKHLTAFEARNTEMSVLG